MGEERRIQNLILEDRKRLNVSGVEEVISFDDVCVRMHTVRGELSVYGGGLRLEELSVDTGELRILGEIRELTYEDKKEKRGLLARWTE